MDVRDDVLWRSLLRGDWTLFYNGGRCVKDTSAKSVRLRSQLLIAFCSSVAPDRYKFFQALIIHSERGSCAPRAE